MKGITKENLLRGSKSGIPKVAPCGENCPGDPGWAFPRSVPPQQSGDAQGLPVEFNGAPHALLTI